MATTQKIRNDIAKTKEKIADLSLQTFLFYSRMKTIPANHIIEIIL